MDAALSYWVLADADAAVRYVRRLSTGSVQDDGLDALSELLGVQNPELAVELAAGIDNARLRNESLAAAYAEWKGRDPEAAAKWLARAGLPTEVRHRLQGD